MPRYYLNLFDESGFSEDEEGLLLPDKTAALQAAIAAVRDVTASDIRRGELNPGTFIEVLNDRNELVATINFRDAVRVRDEGGRLQ